MPTDGSEQSQRAIVAGVNFAKELGAEVLGLTVIPKYHIFTYKAELREESEEEFALDSQKRASEYLSFIVETARAAGVSCSVEHAVSDDPYQIIVSTARDRHCDLIVMGSHGRRGIQALLGSETQKVLAHSSVPVLVYR